MISRKAISLTTWFKVPELGMSSYEILSRGSAVVVAMKKNSSPIFLCADRTARPFALRHLFPQPFLDHVQPEHVKLSIETRGEGGKLVERFSVDINSFLAHPHLDVAVMKLEAEDEGKFLLHNKALPLKLSNQLLQQEDMTSLIGHSVEEVDSFDDDACCVPIVLDECPVVACEDGRGVILTEKGDLPPAMSGGAVVGSESSGMENECYGIIEGPLPIEEDDDVNSESFVHCATFTTSVEIRKWLSDPEAYSRNLLPES